MIDENTILDNSAIKFFLANQNFIVIKLIYETMLSDYICFYYSIILINI